MIEKPGPTGLYPQGKLNPDDEGELNIAITRDGDVVRMDFGKPVSWLAMSPDDAFKLAMLLLKYAHQGGPLR